MVLLVEALNDLLDDMLSEIVPNPATVAVRKRTKMPRDLVIGDVIVEGNKTVKVQRIQHYACSKRHTHVNRNSCYDYSVPVVVQ